MNDVTAMNVLRRSRQALLLVAFMALSAAGYLFPTISQAANAVGSDRAKELDIMNELRDLESELDNAGPGTGHHLYQEKPAKPKKDFFKKYVDRHVIVSGMTPKHVIQSWGEPDQIIPQPPDKEVWVYLRKDGRDQHIVFENGRVAGW